MSDIITRLYSDHGYAFHSLIIQYIPEGTTDYDDLKGKLGNNFCFLFFRFFYFYYVLMVYVYKEKADMNIFISYLDNCAKKSKHKLTDNIVADFKQNYDYLYKIFFIDKNIYFSVYFNNLIKYFLPLPYATIKYSPIITFRNGVDRFYKKNDIDYLDNINEIDKMFTKRYVKKKNIDKINYEMDMHLPIKYFDPTVYDGSHIFLIAVKYDEHHELIITDKIDVNKDGIQVNKLYTRRYDKYNKEIYKEGLCYESISETWSEHNIMKDLSCIGILNRLWSKNIKADNIVIDNIIYISVMRKIEKQDLFNVFGKVNFDTKAYNTLFHNTSLDINKKEFDRLLEYPTFFSFTPLLDIPKYFEGRKCLNYKINEDINNILDLTETIVSVNPFVNIEKQTQDEKNKSLYTYLDHSKIMDYYKNKKIPLVYNKNNKCLANREMSIKDFIKDRPYCDINDTIFYVGRRKLQEILYKTRKYDASKIWVYDHHQEIYKKYGFEWDTNEIYTSLYHSPYKTKTNLIVANYDTIILRDIGIEGFFFTDFSAGFKSGGEILLTEPRKYIELKMWKEKTCDNKEDTFVDFNKNKISRSNIKKSTKGAYVCLLMTNSPYFMGALVLGYTLKKTKPKYDTLIMVTPDVPEKQISILKQVFDIVMPVEYVDIDSKIIKDYDTSRFRDVFTKLQCYKLVQYDKILMIDIDMLVLKNMDHLFELDAPAACLRLKDLKHGEKIDKKYIIKNGKLIGGINAGLMLIKPNIDEYNLILSDIKKSGQRQFKNPEQDYLSYHYADRWTNIGFIYNYQVGLLRRSTKYKIKDIYNIHYSSRLKPWKLVYREDETRKWIAETPFIAPHYELWFQTYKRLKKKYNMEGIITYAI